MSPKSAPTAAASSRPQFPAVGGMADGVSCTNNSSGTTCSSKAVLPGGTKSGPNLSQIEKGTFDWQAYKAAHQTTPTATPAPVNK